MNQHKFFQQKVLVTCREAGWTNRLIRLLKYKDLLVSDVGRVRSLADDFFLAPEAYIFSARKNIYEPMSERNFYYLAMTLKDERLTNHEPAAAPG